MKHPFKKQSYKLRKSLADGLQAIREVLLGEERLANSLCGDAEIPINQELLLQTTEFQLKLDKLKEQQGSPYGEVDILERAAVIAVSARAKDPGQVLKWAISPWKDKQERDKFLNFWGEVYGHSNHPSRCKDQYLYISAYKTLLMNENKK